MEQTGDNVIEAISPVPLLRTSQVPAIKVNDHFTGTERDAGQFLHI